MLSLLVCLLLVSKVCWLIWCPSVLIKVIAGLYCFENLLLLVVLFCFVIVGKICYLHLSAVFCWLFPRILLACVIVVVACSQCCWLLYLPFKKIILLINLV